MKKEIVSAGGTKDRQACYTASNTEFPALGIPFLQSNPLRVQGHLTLFLLLY